MQYSREERHQLELALRSGVELKCPVCDARVDARDVERPPEVSYVRHRVWLVCVGCRRSATVDRR